MGGSVKQGRLLAVAVRICVILQITAVCGCASRVHRTGDGGDELATTATGCKVAVVSPVSGSVECVEPRGAAVDAASDNK
jgi:hypothetical protein